MLTVCYIANPFDPIASRETQRIPAGLSLAGIARMYSIPEIYEIAVSVDGRQAVDLSLVPPSGASVALCAVPKGNGKNPLALVASLALMVVTAGYINPAVTAAYGAGYGAAASMGAMAVGGLLINAAFGPRIASPAAPDQDASPTYAWSAQGNPAKEDAVLPEVFGTHRVVPPVISSYREVVGDMQYLNILFAVAGHPVDYIGDVRINETLATREGVNLLKGYSDSDVLNFSGIEFDARRGDVNQSVIPEFDDTRTDVYVGASIMGTLAGDDVWVTRSTQGNAVEGIGVTISFPRGLYHVKDDGGIEDTTLKLAIEYSPHGANNWTRCSVYDISTETVTPGYWSGGYMARFPTRWIEVERGGTDPNDHLEGDRYNWTAWIEDSDGGEYRNRVGQWHWVETDSVQVVGSVTSPYVTVRGASTSPVYRSWHIGNLDSGQYDIRVALYEPVEENNRYGNTAYFESFQEVLYDDFERPGIALLSVRALATDQFSGQELSVDCIVKRETVPVWAGSQYEQLPADNPAWAAYHAIHQSRYKGSGGKSLAGSYEVLGEPASRIVYRDFLSWAGWCDRPWWTGDDGVEHRVEPHRINLYVDWQASVRETLDAIGVCGRGNVVQVGSKYTVIVDRPEMPPIQRFLFSVGNIAQDSFTEKWLPLQDRANVIEVKYRDAAQDYTPQVVSAYSHDYNTTKQRINKVSTDLIGITSRQKAYDWAVKELNANRFMTLTTTHEADVDSIACMCGDVIDIAHDVPQWGYSGRVVSATEDSVTLDREVTIEADTSYIVDVKHQGDDSREMRIVTSAPGVYKTVEIDGAWGTVPEKHAVYSFGEINRAVKPMRVLSISTSGEMRRQITAVEYVKEILEDGAPIPEPVIVSDLPAVASLMAVEVYRGGSNTSVALTWRGYALYWRVWYRKAGSGTWTFFSDAYRPSVDIAGLDYGVAYEFVVSGSDSPDDGKTAALTLVGKLYPPEDVPWIDSTELKYSVLVEWGEVRDFDLWGYELRVLPYTGPAPAPNWDVGSLLFRGNARSYVWKYSEAGRYLLMVRAVDAFGNLSETVTSVSEIIGIPDQPTGSYVFSGQNVVLSWEPAASLYAVDHYVVSMGEEYDTSVEVAETKGTAYTLFVSWGGTRRFWIVAIDVAGNIGEPYAIDVIVIPPGAVTPLPPRVIDNNVLLQWTQSAGGSLPIARYEISRGDAYLVSESVGEVQGTFATVFESSAGEFSYWIVAVDTAGNKSTPAAIPALVSEPPDYVLVRDWRSEFGGDLSSMVVYDGRLYGPVNTAETYSQHFTAYGHSSPAEQVGEGYPMWIQPVPNSASYEEVFDAGFLIEAGSLTNISLSVSHQPEYGSASISYEIRTSVNGVAWSAPESSMSFLADNFRYVRVKVLVSGGENKGILSIGELRLKLDLKQKTDAGRVEVTSNPTRVYFGTQFMDVSSVTATPEGSSALIAIVDFKDAASPTYFDVYLFTAAGANGSGAGKFASWIARGV